MAYPESEMMRWLDSKEGTALLAQVMGKGAGAESVEYGPRKMVAALEEGIGGKGDPFRDPAQYMAHQSWQPPGTRYSSETEFREGGPPRPEGGGEFPGEDIVEGIGSKGYRRTGSGMAWPGPSPKAVSDPTTGMHRIPTPREDIFSVGSGSVTNFQNPHTGATYPTMLEAMWGGIPKPMKEKVKAAGDVAVARLSQDDADTISQLKQMAIDMGMMPGKKTGGGGGVARPGESRVDEIAPVGLQGVLEGASIPGSGEVGVPQTMQEYYTPDDRTAYPETAFEKKRKKSLLDREFAF